MRQWELVGITDNNPYWIPPKKSENVVTLPLDDDDDDLIPEPAA